MQCLVRCCAGSEERLSGSLTQEPRAYGQIRGVIPDSATLLTPEREAGRVAGIFKLLGQNTEKRGAAGVGWGPLDEMPPKP